MICALCGEWGAEHTEPDGRMWHPRCLRMLKQHRAAKAPPGPTAAERTEDYLRWGAARYGLSRNP